MRWAAIIVAIVLLVGCGWFRQTKPAPGFTLPVGKIPTINPPDEPPVKPTAILKAGKYPITVSKPRGYYYNNITHGRMKWREDLWQIYAESLASEIKKHNEIIDRTEKKIKEKRKE